MSGILRLMDPENLTLGDRAIGEQPRATVESAYNAFQESFKVIKKIATAKLNTEERPPEKANLWKILVKDHLNALEEKESDPVIYILGNPTSGKTSILNTFSFASGRNPIGEKEVGIGYAVAKLELPNGDTKYIECFELCGNVVEFSPLISHPIRSSNGLENTTLFLVLDLTTPDRIWEAFEKFTIEIKKGYERYISQLSAENFNKLRSKMDERMCNMGIIMDEHEDVKYRDIFALPLVIVGGKYDEFEKNAPVEKKHLSRLLRILSHKIGASLIFYSNKILQHQRKMKELMLHYAYGTEFDHTKVTNHFEPIYIPHGQDSFKDILPPSKNAAEITLESIKNNFDKRYGIVYLEDEVEYEDLLNDPRYAEPELDKAIEKAIDEYDLGCYGDLFKRPKPRNEAHRGSTEKGETVSQ